jgi:hypothetical protein
MNAVLAILLLLIAAVNAAVQCRLCAEGTRPTDPLQMLNVGGASMSCGDAHAMGILSVKTTADCAYLRNLGKYLCLCEKGDPIGVCNLCQDGSKVPNPNKQPLRGFSCASLANTATRNDVCPLYQSAFGDYCGCTKNKVRSGTCRLCGNGSKLPRPQKTTANGKACLDLEFTATLTKTCGEARSKYAAACCPATRRPTTRRPTTRRPTTRRPTRRLSRRPTRRLSRRPTRRPTTRRLY